MNKEEFLSVASQYYEDFESLKSQPNFYDYEKSFVEIMAKVREWVYGKTVEWDMLNTRQSAVALPALAQWNPLTVR
ncbi:MAG: hypothetical protein LBK58_14570 [Prevotellaceae bacterium]|jgi:hypothetical protein|nr:hypothetical protein [Prevotellaceae bacterium]